jgi:O-methyltransferase involved in polyketide biosynthesis
MTMDSVNKTLYIPLYGKAYVSRRGLFLNDTRAEAIWDTEGFALKGKAASKWLAFYMGIRAAVFDDWIRAHLDGDSATVILHLGCGLDSRVLRVGASGNLWFDVDFPEVIEERTEEVEPVITEEPPQEITTTQTESVTIDTDNLDEEEEFFETTI